GVGGRPAREFTAAERAAQLAADSNGLGIESVHERQGRPLEWSLGDEVEGKARPLNSDIGPLQRRIVIRYSASEAEALQWLSREQTAGGEHPYLLSQGQPTLNRTWIPTQDSPGIRQTWEARIVAPKPLNVVMSGLRQGE